LRQPAHGGAYAAPFVVLYLTLLPVNCRRNSAVKMIQRASVENHGWLVRMA
jgi:hypothetical protein